MSKYQYDENYVRTLLDKLPGTIEDKVKAFAEVHEVKVDVSNRGSYRSPDLVSILTEAVNNNELAKIHNDLEGKISKTRVAYETVNGIGKKIYDISSYVLKKASIPIRYPIYGLLHGNIQQWLSEKHNENSNHYTLSGSALESVCGIMLMWYGYASLNSFSTAMITATIGPSLALIGVFRGACAREKFGETFGSPLTTIPYYALMAPYYAARAIKDSITEILDNTKKRFELEAAELSQLPSAEESIKRTESGGPR